MKDFPLFYFEMCPIPQERKTKWLEFIIIILISVSLTIWIFILAHAYLTCWVNYMEIWFIFYPADGAKQSMHRKPIQTQGAYASADEASGTQGDQMSAFRWRFRGICHLPQNVQNFKSHRGGGVIYVWSKTYNKFYRTNSCAHRCSYPGGIFDSFGHFSQNYNDDRKTFFTLG